MGDRLERRRGRLRVYRAWAIVASVKILGARHLFVFFVWHQDDFGTYFGSDGMPGWMTLTHGAENVPSHFPMASAAENHQAVVNTEWSERSCARSRPPPTVSVTVTPGGGCR